MDPKLSKRLSDNREQSQKGKFATAYLTSQRDAFKERKIWRATAQRQEQSGFQRSLPLIFKENAHTCTHERTHVHVCTHTGTHARTNVRSLARSWKHTREQLQSDHGNEVVGVRAHASKERLTSRRFLYSPLLTRVDTITERVYCRHRRRRHHRHLRYALNSHDLCLPATAFNFVVTKQSTRSRPPANTSSRALSSCNIGREIYMRAGAGARVCVRLTHSITEHENDFSCVCVCVCVCVCLSVFFSCLFFCSQNFITCFSTRSWCV